MYKLLIKPFMFLLDPEKAHYLTVKIFHILLSIPGGKWIFKQFYDYQHPSLHRNICGLNFMNPVGLAAGFDKDGKYFKDMAHLGFGFIEIGTVTPLPQSGNDKPRLFRLPEDQALINRMGFNNDGVEAMVSRLKSIKKSSLIIGGNIGKNKITPNEQAVDDYVICFNALFDYVDYFVVNVSSPNTPGLRELQDKGPLTHILTTLMNINNSKSKSKPLFLKIAPDLTYDQLNDIVELTINTKIDGIIATNTTIVRDGLHTDTETIGAGGLSGQPLSKRSTEVIKYIHQKSKGAFVIIGVGGISDVQDAKDKLDAGAALVQVYSGLIYEGPSLVKNINKQLAQN